MTDTKLALSDFMPVQYFQYTAEHQAGLLQSLSMMTLINIQDNVNSSQAGCHFLKVRSLFGANCK